MQVMVFTAILTNCAILGFSSEQLMQWMPWLFTRDLQDGDQMLVAGSGRFASNCIIVVSVFVYSASYNYSFISSL